MENIREHERKKKKKKKRRKVGGEGESKTTHLSELR